MRKKIKEKSHLNSKRRLQRCKPETGRPFAGGDELQQQRLVLLAQLGDHRPEARHVRVQRHVAAGVVRVAAEVLDAQAGLRAGYEDLQLRRAKYLQQFRLDDLVQPTAADWHKIDARHTEIELIYALYTSY